MSDLKLHLVSFDIPYPPDYGGVIDVFYKIKNLAEAGVKIYLHCPVYANRKPSSVLESYCEKVWYYPRASNWTSLSLNYPYMVYSRRNRELLHNLATIEAPILFDGANGAFYLSHPALKNRLKIFRPQNLEHDYYRKMAGREKNLLKKLYFHIESRLLKKFEYHLQDAAAFFTVAMHDHEFFKALYPQAHHEYLPSFQPYNDVVSQTGSGNFCIYHGNMAHAENKEAATFLLEKVIPFVPHRFIIAGRNPSVAILGKAAGLPNCQVIVNPEENEMNRLIHEAHIHVLPTFQNTGLKLKLLHALFNGRHVLVNPDMLNGTGLAEACHIAQDSTAFIRYINELMKQPFAVTEIEKRKTILLQHYDNRKNAQRIITYLQQKSL